MTGAGATRPRLAALASTDCHTCLSGKTTCQRQRPYCSTCLDRGIKCGGYATALSWHESRTYMSRNRQRYQQASGQMPLSHRQHKYRFKESQKSTERSRTIAIHSQHPGPPSQDRDCLSGNHYSPDFINGISSTPEARADCIAEDFASQNKDGLHDVSHMPVLQPTGSSPSRVQDLNDEQYLSPSHKEGAFPDVQEFVAEASSLPDLPACDPTLDATNHAFDGIGMCADDIPLMLYSLATTAPTLSFLDPTQQRKMLLKCYDTDLCVLPLTSDLVLNPFRIRGFEPETSQLLLHSILALSSQHQVNLGVGQTFEAQEHRSRASELLALALQNRDMAYRDNCILAAILILITLDCTISASGNWSDHIGKAAAVLEEWGGTAALKTPRIRSQVSMLVWWDATLALISRQGTMFSSSYFDYLVRNEERDGWSFFGLTGCPTELLTLLMRLVEMARQKELAASMEYLTFAMDPVRDIEQKLLSWKNIFAETRDLGQELESRNPVQKDFCCVGGENSDEISPTSFEGDEEYFQQQDRRHLAEAWRYALLLYIQRVFRWDRQSHRRPSATLQLTCSVLEHARNCRKTSQAQKQLLLPIFLAGAEVRDEDMRDTVRTFCLWWGARSRYGMFYSVLDLLEEYWVELQCNSENPIWWGSFLDKKSTLPHAGQRTTQFLFG